MTQFEVIVDGFLARRASRDVARILDGTSGQKGNATDKLLFKFLEELALSPDITDERELRRALSGWMNFAKKHAEEFRLKIDSEWEEAWGNMDLLPSDDLEGLIIVCGFIVTGANTWGSKPETRPMPIASINFLAADPT